MIAHYTHTHTHTHTHTQVCVTEMRGDPSVDYTVRNLVIEFDIALADLGISWSLVPEDEVLDLERKRETIHRYLTTSPLFSKSEAPRFSTGWQSATATPKQMIAVAKQQQDLRLAIAKTFGTDIRALPWGQFIFFDEIIFDSKGRIRHWGDGVVKSTDKYMVFSILATSGYKTVIMMDTEDRQLMRTIVEVSPHVSIFYSERRYINTELFVAFLLLYFDWEAVPRLFITDKASCHAPQVVRCTLRALNFGYCCPNDGGWTPFSADTGRSTWRSPMGEMCGGRVTTSLQTTTLGLDPSTSVILYMPTLRLPRTRLTNMTDRASFSNSSSVSVNAGLPGSQLAMKGSGTFLGATMSSLLMKHFSA